MGKSLLGKKILLGLTIWKDDSPQVEGEVSSQKAWQAALRAVHVWNSAPERIFLI